MLKNLLLVEINECDFDYFLYGSKKYKYSSIQKLLLDKKKLNTFTNDKFEGFNLDPWVQWVSVHTGKLSKEHKNYRLGQKLNKADEQIWDKLSKKKITNTIWGAFNSTLNSKKNINLFFPDPWSFKEKAFPDNFNNFLMLPRYYAQNYPKISKFKATYYGLILLYKIIFSKSFFYLFQNSFQLTKIFLSSGLKSFNLYFFLDLISVLIIKNNLKKNKSDFTIIALNSFAHYQHNYWNDKQYEFTYFWYLNKIVKIIDEISKTYNSTIIMNGFSQKKIKNEYYLRPKNPKQFLKRANLNYLSIEPNMTTGAIINFKSIEDKNKAINKLKKLKIYDYPIFEIQDYKNTKRIFYRFSLVSKKNKYYFNSLEKKNYKNFFKKPKKLVKKSNIKNEDRLLIDDIFKDTIFMKSSSKHVRKGVLYYKNFKFLKKNINNNRIHNIDIFKNIMNYFE
jgi:hypothetical protein